MQHVDVVKLISDKTGLPKSSVTEVLDVYHGTVKEEVAKGGKVDRRGFGTFIGVLRKAKVGRAVKSGDPVQIPERVRPKFKPSKEFITAMDKVQ